MLYRSLESLGRWTTGILSDFSIAFLSRALWMLNHVARTIRLSRSAMYELRASASLLNTDSLRGAFLVSLPSWEWLSFSTRQSAFPGPAIRVCRCPHQRATCSLSP